MIRTHKCKTNLTPEYLTETYLDWKIIDPLIYARKLNQILKTEEIRRVFHEITRAYEAIRRWEILEWRGFDYYPKLIKPLEGEEYLLPMPDGHDGLALGPRPWSPCSVLGLLPIPVLPLESKGRPGCSSTSTAPVRLDSREH